MSLGVDISEDTTRRSTSVFFAQFVDRHDIRPKRDPKLIASIIITAV